MRTGGVPDPRYSIYGIFTIVWECVPGMLQKTKQTRSIFWFKECFLGLFTATKMVPIITSVPWLTYVLAAGALWSLLVCIGSPVFFLMKTFCLREPLPRKPAVLMRIYCMLTSMTLFGCMLTVASFFANNSFDAFPSPSQPAQQPCGLMIPDGGSNNTTAQYFDISQKSWVWVDLSGTNLSEENSTWEYSQACLHIFTYDIVSQDWALECSDWCERHFGNFIWNEACAFGLVNNENPKAMNVLRACQKAAFSSSKFSISSESSRTVCMLVMLLGCCSGVGLHFLSDDMAAPKFHSVDKDGKLKLAPFVAIPCVTRKTEILFDISKMAVEFILDIFSDFSAAMMYFSHGQIFFGFYMSMVLVLTSGNDLLGIQAIAQLCWSLEHATPHSGLINRKAGEVTEGFAGLVCVALFFLRVPAHDHHGQALLSKMDLTVYTMTLLTSMTGIYSGAEACIHGLLLDLYPELKMDMDERYEKFTQKSTFTTAFALAVLVTRISVALTLAVLIDASSTPFLAAKQALGRGSEAATVVAGTIILIYMVLSCPGLIRSESKLSTLISSGLYREAAQDAKRGCLRKFENFLNIAIKNFGIVGTAFASCFAAGYLDELRLQGRWNNLPWHDEWIHLSRFGVSVEGDETGRPQHAMVVQTKYLICWSLIWLAEVCSRLAPFAAAIQIGILVREHAAAPLAPQEQQSYAQLAAESSIDGVPPSDSKVAIRRATP